MVADHKSNKNGLVELFRFICAVWVAYFHGFFPIITDNFNGIVFAVEFFFMVSGFFFLRSMEKYKEKPFLEGEPKKSLFRLRLRLFPSFYVILFLKWISPLIGRLAFCGSSRHNFCICRCFI